MWKKLYCGGLESGKMNPWEEVDLKVKKAMEELIEEGFLIRHPKKKHFVAMTDKGHEEVQKFMDMNPSMFLLIQQSVIQAITHQPIKKGEVFLQRE